MSPGTPTMPAVSPEKTKTNPLGAGRNPRAGEPANVRIAVRLTESEHARYQAAAVRAELTLVDWIREQCERGLPKRRKRGGS